MPNYGKYTKKYNSDWENEPLFKGWLEESKVKIGAFFVQKNLQKYGYKSAGSNKVNTLTNLGVVTSASCTAETKEFELKLTVYMAFHSAIKGIDHLTDLLNENVLRKNIRLHRTKCSALLKSVISPSLLTEIIDELGSSFYSLILDESTDISTVKYMAVCIRYYSTKHCVMRTEYLAMFEVVRATSQALYEALKLFLLKNKINISKLVGIGSDGANNVIGEHNSLFALLKKDLPNLQLIKCVCHSIHLCSEKACDELPANLDFIIRETYNWFSHSSLRKINYEAIYALINNGIKPLKLISPAKTCWLSRFDCMDKIINQWLELQTHFDISNVNDKCYTARLLVEMYKDNRNYLYFIFLKPILKELNDTNILFQSDNADAEKIYENLKSLIISVCSRILTEHFKNYLFETKWSTISIQATLNNVLSYVKIEQVDYGYQFESKLREFKLNLSDSLTIKTRCFNFLKRLANELVKRLPSNVSLLEKLKYFSPNLCLNQMRPKFNELAIDCGDNFSDLENQWRNLLTIDWGAHSPNGIIPSDTVEFWSIVFNFKNAVKERCFEKLALYVLNFLSLPISNAAVERVFSVLNSIKTKSRNRLNLNILDAILRVRLYCYSRKICCKNFEVTPKMLKLFTSQMYLNLSNSNIDEIEFEEFVNSVEIINHSF